MENYENLMKNVTISSIFVKTIYNNESTTMNPILNLTEVRGANTQLKLYDIFIPLLGILIIVTNLFVVLSSGLLLKKGANPRTTYLFLGNVAMADLVTGIAVLLGQYYPKTYRTHFVCSIQIGLIVSSTLASIYSVGLIAIDRFLYIIHGLKYHRWVYPTRARLLIGFSWTLGIILGFLPSTGIWTGSTENGKICWFISLAPPGLILLITIIGMIPVILVIILYSIILYHAIKKVIQLRKADKNRDDKTLGGESRIFRGGHRGKNDGNDDYNRKESSKNKPSKIKAVKVVLLTCGSFVVTWVPYFVASSIYVFCDPSKGNCKTLKVAIASPLAILGFLNSLLNPLIYAWWHNGFRNFIRKYLCKGKYSLDGKDVNASSSTKSTNTNDTSNFSSRNNSKMSKNDKNDCDLRSDNDMHVVQLEIRN